MGKVASEASCCEEAEAGEGTGLAKACLRVEACPAPKQLAAPAAPRHCCLIVLGEIGCCS